MTGAQAALDFTAARQQRDTGIARASEHAEALDVGWSASAYRLLCDYATQTAQFTSEDFRAFLDRIKFPVEVPKALGGIFQRTAKQGVIRKIGFGVSKQRHLSPCPLWESQVYRDPLASKCHDSARQALESA